MQNIAKDYFKLVKEMMDEIIVTSKIRGSVNLFEGIEETSKMIIEMNSNKKKLIFIGNGASQAISSHLSTDFWKNGGIEAMAFTDPSLLTCIGNDYGYEQIFAKPIEMFAKPGDILVAISSSGNSKNILNATDSAIKLQCGIVTLSGFMENNLLREYGDINYYVPICDYGPVEVLHHQICHCILDTIRKYQRKDY